MNVTANGFGSREKGRIALKKSRHLYKHDDNPMALSTVLADGDEEIVDAKPLAMSSGPLSSASPKRSVSRLAYLLLSCCHMHRLGHHLYFRAL